MSVGSIFFIIILILKTKKNPFLKSEHQTKIFLKDFIKGNFTKVFQAYFLIKNQIQKNIFESIRSQNVAVNLR